MKINPAYFLGLQDFRVLSNRWPKERSALPQMSYLTIYREIAGSKGVSRRKIIDIGPSRMLWTKCNQMVIFDRKWQGDEGAGARRPPQRGIHTQSEGSTTTKGSKKRARSIFRRQVLHDLCPDFPFACAAAAGGCESIQRLHQPS